MTRGPVRIGAGRLAPAVAEQFPWRCAEHVAANERSCRSCCGSCYFLEPGAGCTLGGYKPVRCKTYPLIPQRDRIIVHGSCPDSTYFVDALAARDPRALALLEMAVAMSDLVHEKGDDQSQELAWLMDYAKNGFRGPVVWKRGAGLVVPERARRKRG